MAEVQLSLYERLGGYDAIYAMAAVALKRAMQDDTIGHFWNHATEASMLEEHINFVDFLCHLWGGKARYRGRDMVTAHRGMGVTEEHWDALFQIISDGHRDAGLPQHMSQEIIESLVQLKPTIVGSPSYRQVLLDHPDMDITKGMRSVGVVWPNRRARTTSDEMA